jgi:lipid-A-disaccharide synthase
MKPFVVMLVAAEASGDKLAAELVDAIRPSLLEHLHRLSPDLQPCHTPLAPRFFGVGGPHMAAAGVELLEDTVTHAVFGLGEVLLHLAAFRRLLRRLVQLARQLQPDLVVLIDSSGLNLRLAAAIRRRVRSRSTPFHNWRPRIVYFVSPQVWASRPGRAFQLERDVDLVLSIFPFEPRWYARRTPNLPVEFVGHPLVDRYAHALHRAPRPAPVSAIPLLLLLPGSRPQELRRHLPPMIDAVQTILVKRAVRLRMILPNESLCAIAQPFTNNVPGLETRVGGLAESLAQADIAIASSGTVTLECAFFGVPAVVIYRVAWPTYVIGRQLVDVPFVAMPNLLADAPIFPEFIQNQASPENIARATLDLLMDDRRRTAIQRKLKRVIRSLGPPGATHRAARAILRLLAQPPATP